MSNHDLTVANGPGIDVRQDMQAALQALGSNFQGGAQPLATYPCQMWADSTNGQLKIRNIANTAWIVLGALDTAAFGHLPLTGGALAGPGNLTVGGTLGVTGQTNIGAALVVASTFTMTAAAAGVGHTMVSYVAGKQRWFIQFGDATAESGSNAGSNFQINNVADDGATVLGTPLAINRATGALLVGGNPNAQMFLNSTSGNYRAIVGTTASVNRWSILLGDFAAESGSNAGANFVINRFTDAGGLIDSPLSINRASGAVALSQSLTTPATVTGGALAITGAAGSFRQAQWYTGASLRYVMQTEGTAESGANAGSNFTFNAFGDAGAGAPIGAVYSIVRATRVVTFTQAIVNGPSDRSLKENIAPLQGALAKVEALQGVSFNLIGEDARQIGLIAQDVAPIVPEVIQPYEPAGPDLARPAPLLALDYPKLTALLIEAVKELSAKVAALESQIAGA